MFAFLPLQGVYSLQDKQDYKDLLDVIQPVIDCTVSIVNSVLRLIMLYSASRIALPLI